MAIKIYNDITLDSNQIKDVSLERLGTAQQPAGFEGQIYYCLLYTSDAADE